MHSEQQSVPIADHTKDVDLLFRYYQLLKQDLLLQTGSFKNHVRNSQIAGGALVAILPFMITRAPISQDNKWLWIIVMVTITTVIYYLIFDVMEAVFAIRALEGFLSFLEKRMNKTLGTHKLIWQSAVAEKLWPPSKKQLGFTPPMIGLLMYELFLVAGATLLLPGYVYVEVWLLPDQTPLSRIGLLLLALYSGGSAAWTFFLWRAVESRVRKKVQVMTGEKFDKTVTLSGE